MTQDPKKLRPDYGFSLFSDDPDAYAVRSWEVIYLFRFLQSTNEWVMREYRETPQLQKNVSNRKPMFQD